MRRVLPILFNTDMVRAILDGRKTVTRRLVKHDVDAILNSPYHKEHPEVEDKQIIGKLCMPPYQPEDTMYVRETWRVGAWDVHNQMIAFDYKDGTCGELTYIHDCELFERLVNQSRDDARKAKCEYNGVDFVWKKGNSPCRWHPNIHMPKEAARIWLKVKDVRVERLQNMDWRDALDEGVNTQFPRTETGEYIFDENPIDDFIDLWNSTIKKSDIDRYGWDASPWVWVIEFELCEKPDTV